MRLGISSTLMQTDFETAQQQCTIHEEIKQLLGI